MDAAQALADLTEISSQVVEVAIVDGDKVLATTIDDPARAERFVDGVSKLLAEADSVREAHGLSGIAQLEAATLEGSVFVVRRGERMIASTTRPDPTVGLVFYDLKHCLRSIDESGSAAAAPPKKSPAAPKKGDAPAKKAVAPATKADAPAKKADAPAKKADAPA